MTGAFRTAFGRDPELTWQAPGRVNVIGEHTDYNDGFALPIALPVGVRATVATRDDGVIRAVSVQDDSADSGGQSVRVDELRPGGTTGWAAYVLGVVWALREAGHPVPGADILVDGSVPMGSGLSSSAALECAVAGALSDVADLRLDPADLVAIARSAENDFVGVPTGALDQTASVMCTSAHALLVDFATMDTRQVPFDLARNGSQLVVIDTRAPHRLVDGEYAARRRDCAEACEALGVDSLREVGERDQAAVLNRLTDDVLRRRVRHILTENTRVQDTAEALADDGDPRRIGPILTASHTSLRDDYEVSCAELDLAVDAALAAGAHGARMTGGGFGGSAIALVDTGDVDAVRRSVTDRFARAGVRSPEFLDATPSRGAHRLVGEPGNP